MIIHADYFVCRRWLKLGRSEDIEFREHEVRAWNPCGLISLGVAVAIGALGVAGVYPAYYASFIAMVIGPLLHIAITAATRGRYYTPAPTQPAATHEQVNSDRPAGECQPLRYWPRRQPGSGTPLRLAYLEIPDAEHTWSHLGASPYWCWGHELGLNEWGVAIGNEALFTRDLADHISAHRGGNTPPRGLLGMELVRLGLERARTATEAVTVITELLTRYGQWGSGVPGRTPGDGAYDNSYLIADPHQAWVVETSGRRWAAREITTGTYAISNQATIRAEWNRASDDLKSHAIEAGWWPAHTNRPFDFARAYTDPQVPLQASHIRLQRARHLLTEAASRGAVDDIHAARVLRDHYEDTFLDGPYFTAALPDLLTLCMHDSPAGFTWGNTASSAIMHLPESPGRLPVPWWAATTPCTSIYLPVFPAACTVPDTLSRPLPPSPLPRPEDITTRPAFDAQSYWWQFQRLLDHTTGDNQAWSYTERQPAVRNAFDPIERRWAEQLPAIEHEAATRLDTGDEQRGRTLLREFTERCAHEALEACGKLLAEFGQPAGE